MSKTTNYQLTLWDYADEGFGPERVREDLAANFTKLDTALKAEETARAGAVNTLNTALAGKAAIVTGSYVGDNVGNDSTEQTISLGFTPKAVLVVSIEGRMGWVQSQSYCHGGLALPGKPLKPGSDANMEVVTGGFRVWHRPGATLTLNAGKKTYYYIAFR